MSFVTFAADDSVVSAETLIAPMWSSQATILTSFYTSSTQEFSTTGKFYTEVYDLATSNANSEVQFSVAYGHISGSSASPFNTLLPSYTATRNVYGQFRNLLFGDENATFNFGGSNGIARDIYVISINRSRFKESINPGSLNLKLGNGSTVLNLTDNSLNVTAPNYIGTTRYYYIVSGSNGVSYNSTAIQTSSGSYGMLIPDMGLIILNPRALSLVPASGGLSLSIDETTPASYPYAYSINNRTLIYSIGSGSYFSLKNSETMSSRYFWVRVKNREFNYTTNPSIIDGQGNILYTSLIDSPQTYITTIGLFNNSNELLAVAKLSKPLVKDFTKELTVRVKLDF